MQSATNKSMIRNKTKMYDENECCKNANSGKMNRNLCTTKNAQLINNRAFM